MNHAVGRQILGGQPIDDRQICPIISQGQGQTGRACAPHLRTFRCVTLGLVAYVACTCPRNLSVFVDYATAGQAAS